MEWTSGDSDRVSFVLDSEARFRDVPMRVGGPSWKSFADLSDSSTEVETIGISGQGLERREAEDRDNGRGSVRVPAAIPIPIPIAIAIANTQYDVENRNT